MLQLVWYSHVDSTRDAIRVFIDWQFMKIVLPIDIAPEFGVGVRVECDLEGGLCGEPE
jgi:hypothetical protein